MGSGAECPRLRYYIKKFEGASTYTADGVYVVPLLLRS